ncbi:MFS transporter [Chryseobacterium sp. R2ACT005]|uniref:MFS transporter n=1 Tax=Chryseobacterium sp. R2ACT005 TaxID=3416668 RepID=UPI003CF13A29
MESTMLKRSQILIMAVTCGICIANVYYSQPLLPDIAKDIGSSNQEAGLISVFSQVGYGLGLFFITPLGDKMDRKKLILALQGLLFVSLIGMAASHTLAQLYLYSFTIGLFAIVAQVILPMAASMVSENRGKVVGQIFTGLLIGVLSARVFSGFIGEWFKWRCVYVISSGMVLISALGIQFNFISLQGSYKKNYFNLLKSTMYQLKRFSMLRRTALTGALIFGTLSSFWTVFTFHLSESPMNLSSDKIGLFGLLAVAGALMAPIFGKNSDKNNRIVISLVFAVLLILISEFLFIIFPFSIWFLAIGVLLLDLGVQAAQVTNISLIYTFDDKAGSRINTVYMTAYFLGGSLGGYCALLSYQYGGWTAVIVQMLFLSMLALLTILYKRERV